MSDFDASPRQTKRRRTGTYATRRTTLGSSNIATEPAPAENDATSPAADTESAVTEPVAESRVTRKRRDDVPSQVQTQAERQSQGSRRNVSNGGQAAHSKPNPLTEQDSPKGSETTTPSGNGRGKNKKAGVSSESAALAVQDVGEATDMGTREDQSEDTPALDDDTIEVQTRSSGRSRRPPKRFLSDEAPVSKPTPVAKQSASSKTTTRPGHAKPLEIEVAEALSSPQPKGILTPSRRGRRPGVRKSVVFDNDEQSIQDQLGFKDIDSSSKKKRKNQLGGLDAETSRTSLQLDLSQEADVGEAVVNAVEDVVQDVDEPLFDDTPDLADILSLATDQADGTNNLLLADVEDNEHVTKIKVEVLGRLTSHTPTPITHLEKEYSTLHNLLTATVAAGESNSLLLLGSRGSGKSLLVEQALRDLSRQHRDDFHVVRLNGFLQTDDKLALREIWRQLGREMAVSEDETGEISSYADTMASLLSLLSHPEELNDPDAMVVDGPEREEVGEKTAKSVIFIMDEFDLFTTHPRQTLLYNLFDIAQAKKAPIAVVGCSTRMDVVDLLEKRVKSRFSHRWLHVPAIKTLSGFEEVIMNCICLPVEGTDALNVKKGDLDWRLKWNEFIKSHFLPSSTIQSLIRKVFYSTRSVPDVLAGLHIPLASFQLPNSGGKPADHHGEKESQHVAAAPSLIKFLPQLPTLHLALLVAASRLETIYNLTTVSFTLAHSHYRELLARSKLQRSAHASLASGGAFTGAGLRSWSVDTARGAWEELALWELITPVAGGNPGGKLVDEGFGGEAAASRLFRLDVTLDEVAWAVKEKMGVIGPGEVLSKWCKEV